MTTATALMIDLVLTVLEKGPALITKMIEIGKQTGELTPEQAAAFEARKAAAYASDAWKTDDKLSE